MPLLYPDELTVGIPELDEQHRTFYARVERLHDAMRAHELHHAVEMAQYLADYARDHFATEERLMVEAAYPGFPDHLKRHEEFKRDLDRWRARLDANGPSAGLVVELSSWLTDWLREHIRAVDAEMARFLRGRKPTR